MFSFLHFFLERFLFRGRYSKAWQRALHTIVQFHNSWFKARSALFDCLKTPLTLTIFFWKDLSSISIDSVFWVYILSVFCTIGTSHICIMSFYPICYKVKPFFPIFSYYYVRLSGNLWLAFNPAMCNEVPFALGKVERRIIWQSDAAFFSKEIVYDIPFCWIVHCHDEFLYDDSWNDPFCLNSSVSCSTWSEEYHSQNYHRRIFFKRNLVGTCSGLACHHVSRFYFKKKISLRYSVFAR